ncbi:MAG: putative quinol monooxygenase [Acidimicrobiales bacterium]|jgi:quinol monooxygenase YgiN
MIVITGSLVARAEDYEELERLSLAHVQRSRLEPGCIAHGVHRDVENPLRLVFLEKWQDQAAVDAHFGVPESIEFVQRAVALADGPPTIEVFDVGQQS